MTLLEYLNKQPEGEEVTVCDNVYDMETYFYATHGDNLDEWDSLMNRLANVVEVLDIGPSVVVNFWDVIDRHRYALLHEQAYYADASTEDIMDDLDMVLAGNVSERWFEKFVKILEQ